MTQKLMSMALLVAAIMLLASCIVRTGPRHSQRSKHSRACPPAHHWNGYACVHNGRARGHRK
jgi:hypothetical protein